MASKKPAFTPVEFTVPEVIGTSSDGRTNKWRITCPACGCEFTPQSTMLRWQHMVCPRIKCSAELHADYKAYAERVKVCK